MKLFPGRFFFLEVINIKTERITFRMTSDELGKIQAKANKANMKISEYLRQTSLNNEIVVIEDLKEFTKELRGIGTNLNQLTILCHQGRITCPNIFTTQEKVNQIWQSLNLLMERTRKKQV